VALNITPVTSHREREKGVLVYPVISRRSGGLSVGINLYPDKKFCLFDCPYCEVFPFAANASFSLEQMEQDLRDCLSAALEQNGSLGTAWTPEIRQYEYAAGQTERYLDQYLRLAGTNMAAVVSHEDRLSANFLVSLEQYTQKGGIGCVGLSGGGARSSLLQGSCEHIRAAVVVGMMSTYRELLTRYIETHTNILFPEGLADFGDWPDVAGARSPSPLMVLYDREDQIFPLEGMQAADRRLTEIYTKSGAKDNYHGEFFPGQHKFDVEMQEIAFQWLKTKLQK